MRLFNYWRSSSSWRVRIALAYKDLPYEYVAVHLLREGGEQFHEAHRARNPQGQVPVLEVTEGGKPRHLSQSVAILEYLEERHPDPPLLPKEPLLRAEVRRQVELVNSGIQPMQNLLLGKRIEELGGDKAAWNKLWNEKGLAALEAIVQGTHGRFSVGDRVTMADVCLVPQLYSARRFGAEMTRFPTLLAIEKNCQGLRAFQDSHPDRQPDAER